MNPPLISCLMLLDEFPWNRHIPWKESVVSALAVCDEVICILGDREYAGYDIPVREYLEQLPKSPAVRVVRLSWPVDWSWMFIAQALNIGLLQAKGTWACRLLMDEIFPQEQKDLIRQSLQKTQADVISISRNYVLGADKMFPAGIKPFFFRRNAGYAYGRVCPEQVDAVMFDNPVRLGFWEKLKFRTTRPANYLSRYPLPPSGTRDFLKASEDIPAFILNTDVTFCSSEEILAQKYASKAGYDRLPGKYAKRFLGKPREQVVKDALEKIRRFMASPNVLTYENMPQAIQGMFHSGDDSDKPFLKLMKSYWK